MSVAWRSLLFVPADAEARIGKAAAGDADAVILDLEDGVGRERKNDARNAIGPAAAQLVAAGKSVVVRINAGWRDVIEDLEAALVSGVTAIMVPKVETGERIAAIAEIMAEIEAGRNVPAAAIVALVESPRGIAALASVASAPRVAALALGPEDFSTSMGVAPTPEVLDLPCRQIALAAAAWNRAAFATPVSIAAFREEGAIRRAADAARSYGVHGALCIHPRQVAIANETFQSSRQEIDQARAIADAWAAAGSRGVAVLDGRMIDAPVAERALRLLKTLSRAEKES